MTYLAWKVYSFLSIFLGVVGGEGVFWGTSFGSNFQSLRPPFPVLGMPVCCRKVPKIESHSRKSVFWSVLAAIRGASDRPSEERGPCVRPYKAREIGVFAFFRRVSGRAKCIDCLYTLLPRLRAVFACAICRYNSNICEFYAQCVYPALELPVGEEARDLRASFDF